MMAENADNSTIVPSNKPKAVKQANSVGFPTQVPKSGGASLIASKGVYKQSGNLGKGLRRG